MLKKVDNISAYVDGKLCQTVRFPCKWKIMSSKFDWNAFGDFTTLEIVAEYVDTTDLVLLVDCQKATGRHIVDISGAPRQLVSTDKLVNMIRLFLSCLVVRGKLSEQSPPTMTIIPEVTSDIPATPVYTASV